MCIRAAGLTPASWFSFTGNSDHRGVWSGVHSEDMGCRLLLSIQRVEGEAKICQEAFLCHRWENRAELCFGVLLAVISLTLLSQRITALHFPFILLFSKPGGFQGRCGNCFSCLHAFCHRTFNTVNQVLPPQQCDTTNTCCPCVIGPTSQTSPLNTVKCC